MADPVTRTYAVRIALKNADSKLPLGMTATVRLAGSSSPAAKVTLPLPAVFQQGQQASVWVVSADDTVSAKPVKVAAYTDTGVVIESGLNGDERIVAAGTNLLTVGEKVRVVADK